MVCFASSLNAHSSTCTPRSAYSRDRGPSSFVRSWQCEQVVKMNASATTFPRYWLSWRPGRPGARWSAAARAAGVSAASAASADVAQRRARIAVRISEYFLYYKFPRPHGPLRSTVPESALANRGRPSLETRWRRSPVSHRAPAVSNRAGCSGAGGIATARRPGGGRNRDGARPGRLRRGRVHAQPQRRGSARRALPPTASTCAPAAAPSGSATRSTTPGSPATCLAVLRQLRKRRPRARLSGGVLAGRQRGAQAGRRDGRIGAAAGPRRVRGFHAARPGRLRAAHRPARTTASTSAASCAACAPACAPPGATRSGTFAACAP